MVLQQAHWTQRKGEDGIHRYVKIKMIINSRWAGMFNWARSCTQLQRLLLMLARLKLMWPIVYSFIISCTCTCTCCNNSPPPRVVCRPCSCCHCWHGCSSQSTWLVGWVIDIYNRPPWRNALWWINGVGAKPLCHPVTYHGNISDPTNYCTSMVPWNILYYAMDLCKK